MTSLSAYRQQTPLVQPPAQSPKGVGLLKSIGQGIGDFGSAMYNGAKSLVNATQVPKIIGSGIREAQSLPTFLANPLSKTAQQASAKIADKPIFGQPTLEGETPLQGLGSAAQVGSFLLPGAIGAIGAAGKIGTDALIGTAQGAGNYLANSDNPNMKDFLLNTLGGTALGGATGAAMEYGPNLFGKLGDLVKTTPKPNPLQEGLTNAQQGVDTAEQEFGQTQKSKSQDFITQEQQVKLDQTKSSVDSSQQNLEQTQKNLQEARQSREQATTNAVSGVNDLDTGIKSTTKTLGSNFGETMQKLQTANPENGLTISNKQVAELNALKENRDFNLPDNLDQENNPALGAANSKFGPIKLSAKNLEELNAADNSGSVRLSHTQAQELLQELNRSTYRETPNGLQVDNQRIGITKQIRQAASDAFGPKFDEAYSTYSKGIRAVKDLQREINLKSNVPLDKTLARVTKLGEDPEGKAILGQYIDTVKKETGVDFTDPVKAIHDIINSQSTLEEAHAQLENAQKALENAQKEATSIQGEVAKGQKQSLGISQKEAQVKLDDAQKTLDQVQKEIAEKVAKGGYLKQAGKSLTDPKFVGRRLAGGLIMMGVVYPLYRAMIKSFSSK